MARQKKQPTDDRTRAQLLVDINVQYSLLREAGAKIDILTLENKALKEKNVLLEERDARQSDLVMRISGEILEVDNAREELEMKVMVLKGIAGELLKQM